MPVTRMKVAQKVLTAFMDAEMASDASAAANSRLLAVLIEARREAQLPPATGIDELELVGASANHSLAARNGLAKAHPLFAALAAEHGMPIAFGPDGCDYPADALFGTDHSEVRAATPQFG